MTNRNMAELKVQNSARTDGGESIHSNSEIMVTSEIMARYKISRSTLYFWSTPARMPACFSRPFPKPAIGGSPKRWRKADVLKWEDEVNATPTDDQSPSQDAGPKP